MKFDKSKTKELLRIYGIFSGILIFMLGIIIGAVKISERRRENKLRAAVVKVFSENTVLVRYEGNEFAVLTHQYADKESALAFAEKIKKELETLDLSHLFNGEKIFLSMSLGIVLFPQHGKIYTDIVTRCSGIPLVGRQRGGSMILFPEDI